ncbi:MAG: hypothetical protein OXN83_04725, partial [Oligoflexia bacterium]|nr:hypothetical protein [Oligoflexia bacterium]
FTFIVYPVKVKNLAFKIYEKKHHQTLSRVEGSLIKIGLDVRVLKVKRNDKIYLEFLSKKADNSYWLINTVELRGNREAYFDYWGEPSSLLLLDDDGDGVLDIVAPTFDKFFLPHINWVVYNEETDQFELKLQKSYAKVTAPDQRSEVFSCGFWCRN